MTTIKKTPQVFKRGILTMAIGNPEYVEMAVDMILSYKLFHKEPASCIVDLETKKIIQKKYLSLFDELIVLPKKYNLGRIRKFCCAELTPYDSTIYLDSDILLLNEISDLWTQGELNNNITMIGDYLENNNSIIHHGIHVSQLIYRCKVNHYLKVNSGCFHFMKEPAKEFFLGCEKIYKDLFLDSEFKKQGWLGDEIAIGIVGHKFNVSCFRIPSAMMWDEQLAVLKKHDKTYPICHFIAPIPHNTVKGLVKRSRKLRKINNIQTGGEVVWFKLNNKRIMSVKPTLLLRIKNKINRFFNLRTLLVV